MGRHSDGSRSELISWLGVIGGMVFSGLSLVVLVEMRSEGPKPWWVSVVAYASAAAAAFWGVAKFVRAFREPTRRRVDWSGQFWVVVSIVIVFTPGFGLFALLVYGNWVTGLGMLAFGGAVAALVWRHLRKPVDPDRDTIGHGHIHHRG